MVSCVGLAFEAELSKLWVEILRHSKLNLTALFVVVRRCCYWKFWLRRAMGIADTRAVVSEKFSWAIVSYFIASDWLWNQRSVNSRCKFQGTPSQIRWQGWSCWKLLLQISAPLNKRQSALHLVYISMILSCGGGLSSSINFGDQSEQFRWSHPSIRKSREF